MQTDDELTALFERAVADLAPDVNFIVHRAEQLGRRLRHRMKFWRAAGSALAMVLVAGGGYAAWSMHALTGTGGHALAKGAAGSAAMGTRGDGMAAGHPKDKASLQAVKQQPGNRSQAAARPMTVRQMLRTLRDLLPHGAVLSDVSTQTVRGGLDVNYNDGNGKVDVTIDITPFDRVVTSQQLQASDRTAGTDGKRLSLVLALSCPHPLWTDEGTRPAGALPISCLVRTPPGGGVERDAVMYADAYGFYGYDIYDQRPDGVEVFIQVANGYFDPYLPHVDRATPPGSMSLWESVVESPAWHA